MVADAHASGKVALAETYLSAVWRFLRRLGLTPADADDAAQEVFLTAVDKFEAIRPGSERAYLFAIAVRVASRRRRSERTYGQRAVALDVDAFAAAGMGSDEVVERRRALEMLDRALAELDEEKRTVFVLYELEEMTAQEIADVTNLPIGTVASRLRRAREQFQKTTRRMSITRKS